MSACPDKELLLHALADGELDAGNALEVESHIAGCAGCAAEYAAIREVKARLAARPLAYQAPASLRLRLDEALAEAVAPPRLRRRGPGIEAWMVSGAFAALAACFAMFVFIPSGAPLEAQLVDAQARSLEAQHLVDVQTSDRHTVKPWFNGKIDFAPPVVDLAAQGYPLVGGRLDRLDGRRVAALVFHAHAHVINLFIWPGQDSPEPEMKHRDGYNLLCWGAGGLTFWAVSDADDASLETFQKDFVAATKS